MSEVFKQTGPTQQITTTGATAWPASALTFGEMCGSVRVYNSGTVDGQVVLSDTQAGAQAPATLADGTPSMAMTIPHGQPASIFGPFQGQVWFNAAGASGAVLQFTPGSQSR